MDPLIDRAALGVTELLSNVHRHARPDKSCTVELELLPERLTVSVRDHDPRLPVLADGADAPDATPLATCGRGLAMVAAVSESWGARPDGENGKVVWFTLPAPAAVRAHAARARRRTAEVPSAPEPAPVRAVAPASAPLVTAASVAAGTPVTTAASVGAGVPAATPATVAPGVPVTAAAAASAVTGAPAATGRKAPARSAVPG